MTPMLGIIAAAVFALIAAALFAQLRAARAALGDAQQARQATEDRLEATRTEIASAKDDLKRKTKLLEEARAEAKKKARREGKKEARASDDETSSGRDESEDIKRLKQAVATLEQQLQRDVAAARKEAQDAAAEDVAKHQAHAAEVEKTLRELRESIKRKAEERPDIPGTGLDLKALEPPVVQELARYFRKGEEFERLYHVAQGKLQLASERHQELQKRYYAVCRELAVAAGVQAQGAEAQAAAETIVAKGDAVQVEGAKKKKRRRRKKKREGGELEGAPEGTAEAPADASSVDETPTEGAPTEAALTEAAPTGAPPVDEAPAEAPAVAEASLDAAPVEAASPVEEAAPVDAAPPVEAAPSDATDADTADEAADERQASGG